MYICSTETSASCSEWIVQRERSNVCWTFPRHCSGEWMCLHGTVALFNISLWHRYP